MDETKKCVLVSIQVIIDVVIIILNLISCVTTAYSAKESFVMITSVLYFMYTICIFVGSILSYQQIIFINKDQTPVTIYKIFALLGTISMFIVSTIFYSKGYIFFYIYIMFCISIFLTLLGLILMTYHRHTIEGKRFHFCNSNINDELNENRSLL